MKWIFNHKQLISQEKKIEFIQHFVRNLKTESVVYDCSK